MGCMRRRILRSLSLIAIGALFLGASIASGDDYPQIQINTDGTNELQNEQCICVNPTNPDNVVACWRDFRLGYRQVGVGYSFDGGYTWTDYLIGGEYLKDSDPVLVVHADGTFYLIVMNYVDHYEPNQLSVHRSTTGGVTWDGPFTAIYSSGTYFHDKEWIAVDRTWGPGRGNLHVAWARFSDVKINYVKSTDRGETWTSPVQVSSSSSYAQWPVPLALANGNTMIAWCKYWSDINYDISTDGGATWGTDRTLTTTNTEPQEEITGGITIFPYPSLALDETFGPRSGYVYCLYADQAIGANGVDIWCRRSTDHAESWSDRVRVNDDPAGLDRDQFHPWVVCDEQGILTAMWYDRRDDPGNYLWHIYMSRSTDGGLTWEENERITDVASSPGDALREGPNQRRGEIVPLGQLRAGLIGEYSGVSVVNGVSHPVWTDTRNGHQDTFTSVVVSGSAVEDPIQGRTVVSLRSYPNPTQGGTDLHLRLPAADDAEVGIYSPEGRLVRAIPLGNVVGDMIVRWDGRGDAGEELPAGVYFARVHGIESIESVRTKVVLAR